MTKKQPLAAFRFTNRAGWSIIKKTKERGEAGEDTYRAGSGA